MQQAEVEDAEVDAAAVAKAAEDSTARPELEQLTEVMGELERLKKSR